MKHIISALLLLSSAALFPAAAAPAQIQVISPAFEAAQTAIKNQNFYAFFNEYAKASSEDKVNMLNELFEKVSTLRDTDKKQLALILHELHKEENETMARLLIIPKHWQANLIILNPSLKDGFFAWKNNFQAKDDADAKAKVAAAEAAKTQYLQAFSQRVHSLAPLNMHPYAMAQELKKVLPANARYILSHAEMLRAFTTPTTAAGVPQITVAPLNQHLILRFLKIYPAPGTALPLPNPKDEKVMEVLKCRLCAGDFDFRFLSISDTFDTTLPYVAEDHEVTTCNPNLDAIQPANVQQYDSAVAQTVSAISSAQIPLELLRLIAGYTVNYRWGQNASSACAHYEDARMLLPATVETLDLNKMEKAICSIKSITAGELATELPDNMCQGLHQLIAFAAKYCLLSHISPSAFAGAINLEHLDLSNNFLTDYPAEIAQLPKLKVFKLEGNPLTPEAQKRYEAFQREVLTKRNGTIVHYFDQD
jgi:hypothetical protein